jgi:Putative amidase domain
MYAGKLRQDGGWYTWDSAWYSGKNSNGQFDSLSVSKTWREVNAFMNHMYSNENTGNWLDFDSQGYSIFDPLYSGDLVFLDWDRDGSFDHTTIITGWSWISGHWEPKLSYHSNNRLDKPFAEVKSSAKIKALQIYDGEVW